MRAIIIEEDRFAEIVDLMERTANNTAADQSTPLRCGWDTKMWASACAEVHRSLHYEFVRWAQSHGASCVR